MNGVWVLNVLNIQKQGPYACCGAFYVPVYAHWESWESRFLISGKTAPVCVILCGWCGAWVGVLKSVQTGSNRSDFGENLIESIRETFVLLCLRYGNENIKTRLSSPCDARFFRVMYFFFAEL